MTYKVELTPQAENDLIAHTKAGNKAQLKKIFALLLELEAHPEIGTGKPEQLKYDFTGSWSRRIDNKHQTIILLSYRKKVVHLMPNIKRSIC